MYSLEETVILQKIRSFIAVGGDVNQKDLFEESFLIRALDKGLSTVASFLIVNGADLDVRDSSGHPALYHAYINGNIEVINLFIRSGVSVKLTKEEIEESFRSICYSFREVTTADAIFVLEHFLKQHDVDINSLELFGEPPIFYLISLKSVELLEFFLQRGLSLFVRNYRDYSPLTFALSELDALKRCEGHSSDITKAEKVLDVITRALTVGELTLES